MFWTLLLLTVLSGQTQAPQVGAPGAGAQTRAQTRTQAEAEGQIPAGWTMIEPGERSWQTCMRPLYADGTVNSRLTMRCETVENGEPKRCQLESGRDQPVRHRAAARCLAPLYRFRGADGGWANGGPVVIPIRLSVEVTNYY
jgi:hypothetical protein